VIAYSLTLAILIPASGYFADRFGIRKIFLSAIFIFSTGSLLCALSHNLLQLTLSRVLQGLGGSMLMPVGRLAVLKAFPGKSYLEAITFVTTPALIGPLIGPILGGWLVEFTSWHWIFLINVPIGIIGYIATYNYMPDWRRTIHTRFDIGGFLLLATTMVSISFGLDGLAELELAGATATVFIIFGLACFAAYWLKAAQEEDPLFSPRIFQISTFRVGLLGNMFSRTGSGGIPFLLPLYLQVGLGYSPFKAGLTMIPVAVAAILAKRFASPLIMRAGYRKFLIINTFLVGIGIASFFYVSIAELDFLRVLQLFAFGFFNSLQFTAMNSLALKDLGPDKASSGNTLFSMVQMLGMSFSVAICAVVLKTLSDHYHASQNPIETLTAFRGTFLCMGAITCCSATIFMQLYPDVKNTECIKTTIEAG
ncbi:MAG: DHA2 family efflux MFS transporter permease subunit, partial [Bdellovibrionia bacterium]